MLCPVESLHAQERPTGEILGQVLDEIGRPLPEVTVELVRQDGAFSRRQLTNRDGRFVFVALPVGRYRVRVEHPGFHPAEREDVRVRLGETTRLRLPLSVAPFEIEGVEVLVSPVAISRADTEFKGRLAGETIELLPVGYDPEALVAHTPGARPGHVWGGATEQANSYQIDGLAANHPGVGGGMIEPSINWIETLEVSGLGSGAEHGNFQGGLIEITTKSGTNRLQGALGTRAESQALNASNLGDHEIGSEIAARYGVEGELRGPLIEHQLFYFVAGQWLHSDARHLNHLGDSDLRFLPTLEETREGKFFGKLTWQPSERDRIDLTAGGLYLRTENHGQSGYEGPRASWRLTAPTSFYGANWRHSWGSRGVIEGKIAAFAREEERTPYAGEAVPGVQTYGIHPPYPTYQNAPLRFRHAPESLSTSLAGRFNFSTLRVGHLLKVGGEYSLGSFTDERVRTGGMTWRPPRTASFDPEEPSTWVFSTLQFIPSTWGGEVRLHADVENSAAYVQDYLTLSPRLSLSPGVRYGRWRGWLRPDGGRGARFLAVEDDAIEPRVGATLDLTGDNTLVAKAHWGRYHQNLLAQMFDRAAGGNVFSNEQLWYYRGDLFQDPRTSFSAEERDRLAQEGLFTLEEEIVLNETGPIENYRQPYLDQWILGLEKAFGDRVKLQAVYVNRRNRDMVALVDRNRESNYTVYEHVRVYDAGGQPLLVNGVPLKLNKLYLPNDVLLARMRSIAAGNCDGCSLPPGLTLADTARLTYRPDYVLTNVPEARREFDQVQVSLTTAFQTWGSTASVVFTRLKGNLDSVTGYDDPAGFGAGPYVRVNESVNAFGSLDNFADRELKVSVYGQLPWRLRGGIFWQYALGDHYSPQFTLSGLHHRYSTFDGAQIDHKLIYPLAGHNVFVGPRGNREYPVRATVDVRLEREFSAGDQAWAITLEAYNVFNASSVTEHNTSVNRGKNYYHFLEPQGGRFRVTDPNEYYQAVRERVQPRRLRLGAMARF